ARGSGRRAVHHRRGVLADARAAGRRAAGSRRMKIPLESIRNCLDGGVPGNIATVSPDGMPNIAYLSQVQYVDPEHVALSYQFFNTTRRNIRASPYAKVAVIDPVTAAHYRLSLQYLRTESQGPVFEV